MRRWIIITAPVKLAAQEPSYRVALPIVMQGHKTDAPSGTPLRLHVLSTAGNVFREEAALLFQQNMSAIGINTDLEYIPASTFFLDGPEGRVFGRTYDVAVFSWLSGVTPPASLFRCSQVPGPENDWVGQNTTGWCHSEYERLITEAESELVREHARSAYQAAQRHFMDAVPALPLYTQVRVSVTNPRLLNFKPDPTVASETWNGEEWWYGE